MFKRNILVFLLLFTPTYLLYSNEFEDIRIINYYESIAVHGFESGFTKTVSITGFCKNKSFLIPAASDSNFQTFTDFKLYYKKNSRYKEFKNPNFIETAVPAPFYTSAVLKAVEIDKEQYFLCTFKINCKHLMLFGEINLASIYDTERSQYEIALPKNLSYRYDSLNTGSLKYFRIDFFNRNDSQLIKIETKPSILNLDPSIKNNSVRYPLIRQIIVPVDKKGKEELFFSKWYLSAIDSVSHLNKASQKTIDSVLKSKTSNIGTIQFYYDFIRLNFKFNTLGIGLGTVIPHDVNTVLKNKMGDCKDLANLLRVILTYKGFDAKLALAATKDHFCDFNFPSLCAGNHAICVVKTDESQLLLDPTDITHTIGLPVQNLQGMNSLEEQIFL